MVHTEISAQIFLFAVIIIFISISAFVEFQKKTFHMIVWLVAMVAMVGHTKHRSRPSYTNCPLVSYRPRGHAMHDIV